MRMVILCTTPLVGGAEIVLGDYLRHHSMRESITVMTSTQPSVVEFFSKTGVTVIASPDFSFVGGSKSIGGVFKKIKCIGGQLRAVCRVLKSTRPQVVVGNNTGDMLLAWVRVFFSRKAFYYYQYVHDMMDEHWHYRWVVKLSKRWVDRYIAVSDAGKRSLIRCGVPESMIEVIYNGVTPCAARRDRVFSNHRLSIGFVGGIIARKSPLSIVVLQKALVGHLEQLRIAFGYAETVLLASLKANVDSASVTFFERLPRDQVEQEIYQKIDFLLVPSLRDPFPTVILEALARGVPVIARAVDGIPEMIDDGVSGFLFQQDQELERIANKLKSMASTDYQAMSNNARLKSEQFSLVDKARRLNRLFGLEIKAG